MKLTVHRNSIEPIEEFLKQHKRAFLLVTTEPGIIPSLVEWSAKSPRLDGNNCTYDYDDIYEYALVSDKEIAKFK